MNKYLYPLLLAIMMVGCVNYPPYRPTVYPSYRYEIHGYDRHNNHREHHHDHGKHNGRHHHDHDD